MLTHPKASVFQPEGRNLQRGIAKLYLVGLQRNFINYFSNCKSSKSYKSLQPSLYGNVVTSNQPVRTTIANITTLGYNSYRFVNRPEFSGSGLGLI